MKVADYIIFSIDRLPKGYIFTYSDFDTRADKREAVIKSLNRLAALGKISKVAKGKYYKPESSAFGILPPSQYQIVKDLLEKNGKAIGYITGYGVYNELGLTTQVSNIIQIGRNEVRSVLKRGIYKIAFVKQKNRITKENIPLLKILDSIRFIKTIPGTSIDYSCNRLIAIIKKLSATENELLIKLALPYPPATRALLGALVEKSRKIKSEVLSKSLNPITVFKLPVLKNILPNAQNWNIQ
ncbi:MAG: DUF6088 family protein [Bacteroidota bacterium]|nr:DUF6088 family protein [Bacteroidota bacterium]